MREEFSLSYATLIGLLIASEIVWGRVHGRHVYQLWDTAENLLIAATRMLVAPLVQTWIAVSLTLIAEYRAFAFPKTVGFFVLALLVVDFSYYWLHRAMHQVALLWCFHHVHHSSHRLNVTTSARLHFLSPMVYPLFFAPAVLLGVSVTQVFFFFFVNLLYQVCLHTQAVGRLSLLDGILNTPSNHRVHHGMSADCIDKNFGGLLVVWDRIFGTYARESGPIQFGVLDLAKSRNPLQTLFGPLIRYLRGELRTERVLLHSIRR